MPLRGLWVLRRCRRIWHLRLYHRIYIPIWWWRFSLGTWCLILQHNWHCRIGRVISLGLWWIYGRLIRIRGYSILLVRAEWARTEVWLKRSRVGFAIVAGILSLHHHQRSILAMAIHTIKGWIEISADSSSHSNRKYPLLMDLYRTTEP